MRGAEPMKKRKHRLTWFDYLLLLILLALVTGTCLKFFGREYTSLSNRETNFTYQMMLFGATDFVTEALQVGDPVYDGSLNSNVGVIEHIEIAPAETEVSRADGTIAMGTDASRNDVVLTICASGQELEDGYRLGDYKITDTLSDVFYTKYVLWYGTITSID